MRKFGHFVILALLINISAHSAAQAQAQAYEITKSQAEQAEITHQYAEAEKKYREVLAYLQKNKPTSAEVTEVSIKLAATLVLQAKLQEADTLYKKILRVAADANSAARQDPELLVWLDDLADAYGLEAKITQRELCLDRQIHVLEQIGKLAGNQSKYLTGAMHKMFVFYIENGRLKEAEKIIRDILRNGQMTLGKDNVKVAVYRFQLGDVLIREQRYSEAIPPLKEALSLLEKKGKGEQLYTVMVLRDLGQIARLQKRYKEAHAYHDRALKLNRETMGPTTIVPDLCEIAADYCAEGKYSESEKLYKEAYATARVRLAKNDPSWAVLYSGMGALYKQTHRAAEAAKMDALAKKAWTSAAGTAGAPLSNRH